MVESAHGRASDAASVGGCRTSSGSRLAMSAQGNQLCNEDGALQRRSRTQRHRARKHMRLIWRGYHLAKGGVHPPGLHRVETEGIDESGRGINREHGSTESKDDDEKVDQSLTDQQLVSKTPEQESEESIPHCEQTRKPVDKVPASSYSGQSVEILRGE